MADEIRVGANLYYEDSEGTIVRQSISDLIASVTTKGAHQTTQSVGFSAEEAVKLGEFTTLGLCLLENLDPTNFIDVRVGTAGAKFAKLFPLGAGINFCFLYLGSGAQVPFVIADTGACRMRVTIFPQ